MSTELLLKPVLKRGALIAAANWQVTLIQATADSIFKLLIATPVIGGLFLVGLVIGTAPAELMSPSGEMAARHHFVSSQSGCLDRFLGRSPCGGGRLAFSSWSSVPSVLFRVEREAVPIEQPPFISTW